MKLSYPAIGLMLLIIVQTAAAAGAQQQDPAVGGIGSLCCCLGQLSLIITPFLAMGVWGIFVIIYMLFVIFCLYKCLTKEDWTNPNDKIAWILVIIFLPLIGSILFLIYNRKKSKK